MRNDRVRATRIALLGFLGAGWLLGLVSQVITRVQTGYVDVWPPQILLGVLLCLGAGAAARVVDPVRRTKKRGALAGIAMIASILVGYLLLTLLIWNPIWSEESGGETWWSLLLEAPFWIGIPAAIGAGMGALGWYAADRIAGPSWPAARPG
jgi:drug/metabolite transporter (DMT)-like permease